MNIPIEIYADLQYPAPPDRHHAMQGDKGFREIRLYPTAGGLPWEPPAGYRLEVRYTKTDGTGGAYDTLPDGSSALMSAQDGCYTVGTVPQMFTAPGLVRVSVVFISGEDAIATFPAYVEVTRCPGVDARSENYENLSPYVRKSGWSGGKLLGTDENGTVVEKDTDAAGIYDLDLRAAVVLQCPPLNGAEQTFDIAPLVDLDGLAAAVNAGQIVRVRCKMWAEVLSVPATRDVSLLLTETFSSWARNESSEDSGRRVLSGVALICEDGRITAPGCQILVLSIDPDTEDRVAELRCIPAAAAEGPAIVSVTGIRTDTTTTFRLSMADGSIVEDSLVFSAEGELQKIVAGGREIPFEWEATV